MPSPKRDEEGLPNSNTVTEVCPVLNLICGHAQSLWKTDHDDFYNPENLAVTSSLHPFWHTKKGKAVIGLVVLTVVGAIVGGAIGGVKAHARQTIVSTMTSSPPSTTTKTTTTSTSSLSSCACSPSVVGAVFSTTTDHSGVVVWKTTHTPTPFSSCINYSAHQPSRSLSLSLFHFLHRTLPPNLYSTSTTSQKKSLGLSLSKAASTGSSYKNAWVSVDNVDALTRVFFLFFFGHFGLWIIFLLFLGF